MLNSEVLNSSLTSFTVGRVNVSTVLMINVGETLLLWEAKLVGANAEA